VKRDGATLKIDARLESEAGEVVALADGTFMTLEPENLQATAMGLPEASRRKILEYYLGENLKEET
jgi:hypothetical protein